jgi:hypothetical protein
MSKAIEQRATPPAAYCGVGREGMKCAVVSWAAPLVAAVLLVVGMQFPALKVVNIFFVAFGVTALLRSVAHVRRYGSCGLGGHVALGALLNALILALVVTYVFTAFDPLVIRKH